MKEDFVFASLLTPEKEDDPLTLFKKMETSNMSSLINKESLIPPELNKEFDLGFSFFENDEENVRSTVEIILKDHSYCATKK